MNTEPINKFPEDMTLQESGIVWSQNFKVKAIDIGYLSDLDIDTINRNEIVGSGSMIDLDGHIGPYLTTGGNRRIKFAILLPSRWSVAPSRRTSKDRERLEKAYVEIVTNFKLKYNLSDQFISLLGHCMDTGTHMLLITEKVRKYN